jgi:hypothetical protein
MQFSEGDPLEWEKMVGVNVWGALNLTRTILPTMLHNNRGKVSLQFRGIFFILRYEPCIKSNLKEGNSHLSYKFYVF